MADSEEKLFRLVSEFGRVCKGEVFYGQVPSRGESDTTDCVVNYQLLAVILLELPNNELPVAVDHRKLRTMASETVDPIDWMFPSTLHRAVPHELHVLNSVNAGYKSQDLLQQPGARTWVLEYARPVPPLGYKKKKVKSE